VGVEPICLLLISTFEEY